MPTSVSRGLPSGDAGSTLPVDATDWQNRANAEVVNLHDRAPVWLNSVAGTNTVTAAAAITIPAYRKGMSFYFVPVATPTGAMTINVDGHGAVAIETSAGNAIANADLRAGTQYMLVYNGTAMVVSGSNVGDNFNTGVPSMYLDAIGDVDVDTSSNVALQEELVESFAFTTFVDNELVDISINIPLVVFTTGAATSDRNGACRVYLDGTAYNFFPSGAKQWNGTIITNGGQWCSRQNVPVDNMVSASRIRLLIPTAGVHSIRTHIAGSTTDTVVSLHGRRRYQVQPVKAAIGEPGPEGMSGTSALTIVRTIALANVTIASGLTSGATLNGVLLATGDNVLLSAQTAPAQNGVYTVVASGAASRHTNFATYDSNCARFFSVQSGTAKADTLWRCTSDQGGTLGATAIVITEFVGGVAPSDIREKLTADRTYYVRADGSDGNNGLANSSGGAFLTIQKAIDAAAALDLGIYNVTITVGAGTFTGPNTVKRYLGSGVITISGAGSTTIVSVTSNSCFAGLGNNRYILQFMKLQTTTSGSGILATGGAVIEYTNIEFGACVDNHVFVASNSVVTQTGPVTISGGASCHLWCDGGARGNIATRAFTLTGTPAFSTAFIQATLGASISAILATFSGSATGVRFAAANGGIINTNGGGASFFPGGTAGTGTNFGATPWGLYV